MAYRPSFFVPLLLCAAPLCAQWEWLQAVQSNSLEPEWGHVVRYCPDSGLVAAGQWRNEARFGDLTFTGPVTDQLNGFVVRYGADGGAEWAHAFRSSAEDRSVVVHGLAVDADGNVIAGIHAPDTLLMDDAPITPGGDGPPNIAMWTVVKFAPNGSMLWAMRMDMATNGAEVRDVDVDPAGDIWVCGLVGSSDNRLFKLSGTNGVALFQSDAVPGRTTSVQATANGKVLLTGVSASTFGFGGLVCPFNNVLGGGASTTWTIALDTAGTAEWYYAPDQGASGLPNWPGPAMAATDDAHAYVIARPRTRISGDTIAFQSGQQGIYLLDPDGTPVWWKRMNLTGSLAVNDLATAPDGSCWVVGDMAGTYDLGDTVVTHQGLFAFQYAPTGEVLQRVFGPNVVDTWSADARTDEVVIGGTQAGTMSFGEHVVTDNWFGLFAARYGAVNDVGVPEDQADHALHAFPNPTADALFLRSPLPGLLSIDVLNGLGQRVRHLDRFDPQRDAIDLTGLPVGVLMVHYRSPAARGSLRVLHQP